MLALLLSLELGIPQGSESWCIGRYQKCLHGFLIAAVDDVLHVAFPVDPTIEVP